MRIFKRLLGRAEMCLNNARHHSEQHIRDANQIRAKAFMTALDDVKGDEELEAMQMVANMMLHRWKNGALAHPLNVVDAASFEKYLTKLEKLRQ